MFILTTQVRPAKKSNLISCAGATNALTFNGSGSTDGGVSVYDNTEFYVNGQRKGSYDLGYLENSFSQLREFFEISYRPDLGIIYNFENLKFENTRLELRRSAESTGYIGFLKDWDYTNNPTVSIYDIDGNLIPYGTEPDEFGCINFTRLTACFAPDIQCFPSILPIVPEQDVMLPPNTYWIAFRQYGEQTSVSFTVSTPTPFSSFLRTVLTYFKENKGLSIVFDEGGEAFFQYCKTANGYVLKGASGRGKQSDAFDLEWLSPLGALVRPNFGDVTGLYSCAVRNFQSVHTLTIDDKGLLPSDNIYSGTITPPLPGAVLSFNIQAYYPNGLNGRVFNVYSDPEGLTVSPDGATWHVDKTNLAWWWGNFPDASRTATPATYSLTINQMLGDADVIPDELKYIVS